MCLPISPYNALIAHATKKWFTNWYSRADEVIKIVLSICPCLYIFFSLAQESGVSRDVQYAALGMVVVGVDIELMSIISKALNQHQLSVLILKIGQLLLLKRVRRR